MTDAEWSTAFALSALCPNTNEALQLLVIAMSAVAVHRHNAGTVISERARAARQNFQAELSNTIRAMVKDGAIRLSDSPDHVRSQLIYAIKLYREAFPVWRTAYDFAFDYLAENAATAERDIRAVLSPRG